MYLIQRVLNFDPQVWKSSIIFFLFQEGVYQNIIVVQVQNEQNCNYMLLKYVGKFDRITTSEY